MGLTAPDGDVLLRWQPYGGLKIGQGEEVTKMDKLATLAALALGFALLSGCGARQDESAVQTDTPAPASEAPVDETYPAEPAQTETLPSDQTDPAMSDTLPPAEEPPPSEPAPPPG